MGAPQFLGQSVSCSRMNWAHNPRRADAIASIARVAERSKVFSSRVSHSAKSSHFRPFWKYSAGVFSS
jgi:hypothetical protein